MKNILMKIKLVFLLFATLYIVGCGGPRGIRPYERLPEPMAEWEDIQPAYSQPETKKNIVLMLPLKGRFASTSKAIRNGFLAAYYHARKKYPDINIKVIDTTNNDLGILYQQAVANGAGVIVGPLTKKELHGVMNFESLPVPVIALNTLDNYPNNTRSNLYQFGLLPQDEAVQVADKMMLEQYNQAAVIFPGNAWGEKIADAFKDRYERTGGQVVAFLSYNPASNMSEQICYFLAQDPNELCVPKKKKSKRKGKKIGEEDKPDSSETMRRQDINTIFLVANAKNARQIVPLLKFYYAGDLPVYATSSIYTGVKAPGLDRDLDGMNFCDMPWVLQDPRFLNHDLQSIRKQIMTLWRDSFTNYSKLYALGIDAYTLATGLDRFLNSSGGLDGASGKLYLDNFNHIYRKLKLARMRNGIPVVYKHQ